MDLPKSASFKVKQNQPPSKLIPITIYVDQKEHQALTELAQALYSTEIPNPMIQQKQRMLPSPKVEELVLAATRQTLMNFIMEQQKFLAQQAGGQYPPGAQPPQQGYRTQQQPQPNMYKNQQPTTYHVNQQKTTGQPNKFVPKKQQ